MAIGDDALADGMDLVTGTADRRNGWQEINKTRDYIAQRLKSVIAALWPLPINKGGTGATTPAAARAGLGAWGNSGAVQAGQSPMLGWNGLRLEYSVPGYGSGQVANLTDVGGGDYLPRSGGTVTGDLFLPNASPAVSGYTVAYINGDGRISRNASSERYKEHIEQVDPASLGDIFPDLYTYQMVGSDTARFGWIAERLAEHPDLEPFVVYARYVNLEDGEASTTTIARDADGKPVAESIDFIALLIAQNAQLHQAVAQLAQRLTALEDAR